MINTARSRLMTFASTILPSSKNCLMSENTFLPTPFSFSTSHADLIQFAIEGRGRDGEGVGFKCRDRSHVGHFELSVAGKRRSFRMISVRVQRLVRTDQGGGSTAGEACICVTWDGRGVVERGCRVSKALLLETATGTGENGSGRRKVGRRRRRMFWLLRIMLCR